jgi:hypothetical protein
LEEELENPMNIHRWRKLEVSHWIMSIIFNGKYGSDFIQSLNLQLITKWKNYIINM